MSAQSAQATHIAQSNQRANCTVHRSTIRPDRIWPLGSRLSADVRATAVPDWHKHRRAMFQLIRTDALSVCLAARGADAADSIRHAVLWQRCRIQSRVGHDDSAAVTLAQCVSHSWRWSIVLLIMGIMAAAATPTFYRSLRYHHLSRPLDASRSTSSTCGTRPGSKAAAQTMTFTGPTTYTLSSDVRAIWIVATDHTPSTCRTALRAGQRVRQFRRPNSVSFDGYGTPPERHDCLEPEQPTTHGHP